MIPIAKPNIEDEEVNLVLEVLKSGQLAQGKKVEELEKNFAEYCGVKYAVAVNSGTAALHCAVYALGISAGDEVITTPFTFVATANPILMQNAKVVFADICKDDFNIDPKEIEKKITDKTKAIIAVDLYGQPFKYEEIKRIADKHNLKIIEDAAQAVGARIGERKAGSFGDISGFSFYATKNLISGEGGIITTNNEEYAELCRRFRHHGQSIQTRYQYFDIGYNYRMMDLQAAIAIPQLKKIDSLNDNRNKNAKLLSEGLKDVKGIITPKSREGVFHVYHQYTILVDDFNLTRDELVSYLKENGVGCGVYYPKPLHLHPHFAKKGYKEGEFPVSEEMASKAISLPVHPLVSEEDIQKVIDTIKDASKVEK